MLLGQNAIPNQKRNPLLWTSFSLSIISTAFGIAKLMKNGPIKMVRKDGKIGGYGTPGFILLMLVVAFNMIGKATWMALGSVNTPDKITALYIWALTCILPQALLVKSQKNCSFYKSTLINNPILFQTISVWLVSFGVKTTCQFIYYHPGYFLLGIFSPFMVSGEVHNKGNIKTMAISPKWTWINFILSIIGSVSGHYAYSSIRIRTDTSKWFLNFEVLVIPLISFLPTFVPAAICLGLLFCSKKLCSSCYNVNLPIAYKTGVDINDFSHIIDLQTGLEYGTNEDKETEQNAHQLEPIASSGLKIGNILEQQQMQIDTLYLQVETLMTELRENQDVLIEIKEFVESF